MRATPPGPILSVVNGAFSERFARIARACGREADVLEVPWGRAAGPDQVRDALEARRLRRGHGRALGVEHRRAHRHRGR